MLVLMVMLADIQKILSRYIFHGINYIILSLKHFDPRSIKLHRILTAHKKPTKQNVTSSPPLLIRTE
jgi:hypothetical protein